MMVRSTIIFKASLIWNILNFNLMTYCIINLFYLVTIYYPDRCWRNSILTRSSNRTFQIIFYSQPHQSYSAHPSKQFVYIFLSSIIVFYPLLNSIDINGEYTVCLNIFTSTILTMNWLYLERFIVNDIFHMEITFGMFGNFSSSLKWGDFQSNSSIFNGNSYNALTILKV